jgi:hypothetical protein
MTSVTLVLFTSFKPNHSKAEMQAFLRQTVKDVLAETNPGKRKASEDIDEQNFNMDNLNYEQELKKTSEEQDKMDFDYEA